MTPQSTKNFMLLLLSTTAWGIQPFYFVLAARDHTEARSMVGALLANRHALLREHLEMEDDEDWLNIEARAGDVTLISFDELLADHVITVHGFLEGAARPLPQ